MNRIFIADIEVHICLSVYTLDLPNIVPFHLIAKFDFRCFCMKAEHNRLIYKLKTLLGLNTHNTKLPFICLYFKRNASKAEKIVFSSSIQLIDLLNKTRLHLGLDFWLSGRYLRAVSDAPARRLKVNTEH